MAISLSFKDWPGWAFDIEPDAQRITVHAPPGHPITREAWRNMPIGKILRAARQNGVHVIVDPLGVSGKSLTEDHLQTVVKIYRTACAEKAAPRLAIAHHFEVSAKTVDRWISAARAQEILGSWKDENS